MKIKNFLRVIEYKSGIHKKHTERYVTFHVNMTETEKSAFKKILIIDDSVDTGASMLSVYNKVKQTFPDSQVYTYALNVFTESEKLIKIDFFTIKDSIIRTPHVQRLSRTQGFYQDVHCSRNHSLIHCK